MQGDEILSAKDWFNRWISSTDKRIAILEKEMGTIKVKLAGYGALGSALIIGLLKLLEVL